MWAETDGCEGNTDGQELYKEAQAAKDQDRATANFQSSFWAWLEKYEAMALLFLQGK